MQLNSRFLRACAGLGLAAGLAMPAWATTFSLVPTGASAIQVGDTWSLNVEVQGAVDLYGYQFSLSYDPTLLQGLSLVEGGALASAGSTFFVPGAFDAATGQLSLTGDTLIGPSGGFSGDGVLATLTFRAIGAGTSALTLGDVMTVTPSLGLGFPDTVGTSVAIKAAPSVPEPADGALVLAGLSVLACWVRARGVGLRP